MLTSLDITRILAESAAVLIDANITGVEYYRKERAVQLYVKKDRPYAATMSFHPQRNGFYILPAGKSRIDTPEKYRPFAREIWDGSVISTRQVANDRMVEVGIAVGGNRHLLIFEIIGPNGNLWHLDGDGHILASLRKKSFDDGQKYKPPPLPDKLDPANMTVDVLRRLFAENPDVNPARLMEKNIYGMDYYLARTLLDEIDISDADASEVLHKRLRSVLDLYHSSEGPIYGYYIKGKSRFYPVKIIGYDYIEKFSSLSDGQRQMLSAVKEASAADAFRERTIKSIRSRLKKAQRLVMRLESDIDEAADYEKYIQYADLLKINRSRLERGMESIDVENVFGEGETITIPLDPRLNGPENIERYSRRFRKGREGLAILERRKENTLHEIETLTEALKDFDDNFEEAQKRYPELLPSVSETDTRDAAPRRPYKEYQTSTGVTVWVGRTEADNDRLTLDYAKPYELWFHASQCAGSHVVMKFPHKKFEPSMSEIAEAASLAAYYSKARGAARVPVSYTRKKYVRKPRGAKPGLVTLQRYETIMVEPVELEKKD